MALSINFGSVIMTAMKNPIILLFSYFRFFKCDCDEKKWSGPVLISCENNFEMRNNVVLGLVISNIVPDIFRLLNYIH